MEQQDYSLFRATCKLQVSMLAQVLRWSSQRYKQVGIGVVSGVSIILFIGGFK